MQSSSSRVSRKGDAMRLLLLAALVVGLAVSMAASRTWYITDDGAGDAPTIQAGIDSAAAGDTVLLACGTYHEYDISIKSGVCLMSETGMAECVTIDAQELGRVFYCVDVDNTTELAGLTITGGSAPYYGTRWGAGMYCERSSLTIKNCRFSGNTGSEGAGMCCKYSTPTLEDCLFDGNSGDGGGGIASGLSSNPTLLRCTFSGNSSAGRGGGAMVETSVFTNCTFSGNSAVFSGGGIYCTGSAEFTGCLFSGNSARSGGGAHFLFSSSTGMIDCTFEGNSAYSSVYNTYGGAMWLDVSDLNLLNCTLINNSADHGGGMYLVDCFQTPTTLSQTIIALNTGGEAIRCSDGLLPVLTCCDIYGNAAGDWVGCIADQYGINGNFSACPSFCNAVAGDYSLCDESPCLPGNHPDGYDCGLIGAWGVGCSCGPSRTEPTTWGGIKSMYK
jgi:predicted outer membrane repeat protein